ncbi:4a-hydroxytetrahydrobiopterin dehydratase [Streptosporangium sp. KLBMP 9127]|nr:4a-hydroxytetrahydrobiopterin dehydratase [Streptosporangium sp. KLBMP 9127]
MLDESEIAERLRGVPEWRLSGREIRRTITAPDFPAAIRVVDEIAVRAEERNHHPDIDIRWRKVHLALTTHDAGGLTEADFALAGEIDRIAESHGV